MSKQEDNKTTGFSWSAEKEAALGDYASKPTDRNKTNYPDSIFSSGKTGGHYDGGYTAKSSQPYRYDFPENSGHVYSPAAYTGQRSKTAYDSSTPISQRRPQGGTAKTAEPAERRSRQQGGNRTQPQKQNNASQKKKRPQENTEAKKRSLQSNGKKGTQKTSAPKKGAAPKDGGKAKEPNRRTPKKPVENIAAQKAAEQKQNNARIRQLEKERKHQQQIEKNNRSYDKARASGKSADESRIRHGENKKKRRKLYGYICVAVLLLAVIGAGLIYCLVYGAPISGIVIENSNIYSEEEILAAASIQSGDNMITVSEKKTSRKLSTLLPYIKSVELVREYPDTLKIIVEQTTDKYHIVMDKKQISLDGDGKVLSDSKKKVKNGSYKIVGMELQEYTVGETFVPDKENGNKEKFEEMLDIVAALESLGITQCKTFDLSNTQEIKFSYADDCEFYTNLKVDNYEYKIATALKGIEEGNIKPSAIILDLRYDPIPIRQKTS